MPLRRDGDEIYEIENFDDWVHGQIEKAIARGEFDNLPLKGKPIKIESNPYQPELDLAFSRLKNAGMAPAWIELDREIRTMQETLAKWLDATAGRPVSRIMGRGGLVASPSGGRLALGDRLGMIHVLDGTGRSLWRTTVGTTPTGLTAPSLDDTTLAVADDAGLLAFFAL